MTRPPSDCEAEEAGSKMLLTSCPQSLQGMNFASGKKDLVGLIKMHLDLLETIGFDGDRQFDFPRVIRDPTPKTRCILEP